MEDITVATMTGLGLEPEYTLLPESFYRSVFERAVELAVDTQRGRYEPVDAQVFACLHALDYDTARLAGKVAGEAGVAGIATGLFGVMKDRNYVDYRVADGELLPLPRAVPRPYPRVVEIAAGLHLGYAEAQGRRPPFHALGVGSPILLPLLALFGDAETYTSTDSTAPIVDGWIAPTISLYVDEPAPFKYKAHRIAEYWLAEGDGWRCECPYCRGFNRSHPPSVDEARRWWKSEGQPRLDSGSMQRTSPLSPLLPMLSNPPDPNVRRQAGMARVGHNHWVLKRIEQGLRDHSGTSRELRGWVERQVAAYVAASASPSWRGALEAAWKIGAAAHDTLNS
jgi:hypothetical protein